MFWYFGTETWNFSSLTRDRTPALEGELLTTGPPGKSLRVFFFVGHLDIRCCSCPSPDLAVKVCEVGWELLYLCWHAGSGQLP